MKKLFISICLLISTTYLLAQQRLTYEYGLTNTYNHIGFSHIEFIDPYLSLLNYSGFGLRLENTSSRYFNTDKKGLISYGKVSGMAALTINPAATASVLFTTVNTGWGILYENLNYSMFRFLMGANVDLDFTYKMSSRNVNNPISIDLATDINAMLGVEYFIPTKKRLLKLRSNIELPVLGGMFLPYPGLILYEMSLSKNLAQAMYFSSLHNKQGLKFQLAFDVPFRYSCWTWGVRTHLLQYQAKDHQYGLNELTSFIGITYDYIRFSGRKNPNPRYFTSPGEYFF